MYRSTRFRLPAYGLPHTCVNAASRVTTRRSLRSSNSSKLASLALSSISRVPRRAVREYLCRLTPTPQERPNPSEQLFGRERLDEVVVRSGIQPLHAVGNAVAR